MIQRERTPDPISEFLHFLASHAQAEQGIPALTELSAELGVSVAGVREQLEVARALGFVEVRPRTGIRRLPFTFLPAVRQSLGYAITLDENYFYAFADLRKHVEAAYWHEAAIKLTDTDKVELRLIVDQAWKKLRGTPAQIPHEEHRKLHLAIYSKLNNSFVTGILEAYWEAYEAVGLNVYSDYRYYEEVWNYHQQMVDAIISGDYEAGYRALIDHTDLIYHRPDSIKK
jgi:DNA-binding FadR family transcriptional regulator